MKPTKHNFTVLKQICNLIPPFLVTGLAKIYGIDKQARSFSPWSHIVSMLHLHLAHILSLNDVADTLRNHCDLSPIVLTGQKQRSIPAAIAPCYSRCRDRRQGKNDVFYNQ